MAGAQPGQGTQGGVKGALLFANVAHFYSHVFMLLYPTTVLAMGPEMGLGYAELLRLSLPGFILFGVAALPAGWLGDKWSAPGMLAIFFLGTGLSSVATGLAATPMQVMLGLAAIGLFASIYHPVGTGLVVRHAVNRGKALGLNGVFGTVGIACAAVIAGTLTDGFGWRAAFIVPGIVCAVTGLAFLPLARLREATRGGAGATLEGDVSGRDAIRGLAILAFTMFAVGLNAQAFLVALPKVFEQRAALFEGGGLAVTGSLVTIAVLLGSTGQLAGGWLADRFSFKGVYLGMHLVLIPVALVAAGVQGLQLVALCAVIQFSMTSALPAENCLVARFCPADWHATAYGAKFVLALGVASAAVPMVGWIFETTGGFFWMFTGLAIVAGAIAACAVFLPGARATAKTQAVQPAGAAE
jgi:FSR family fosmidomycin resistance protein-like MFS transporter